MKKLISFFAFIAICASTTSAIPAIPYTSLNNAVGYIKGFAYATNGDAWVIIDYTRGITGNGTTYSLGTTTRNSWYFYLGNINNTSTSTLIPGQSGSSYYMPTGSTVKTLISELELSKALSESWYFMVGPIANSANNTSNWFMGGQVAVQ